MINSFEADIDFLLSRYGPYRDPKEDSEVAYCAECEYPDPVTIPIDEDYDYYICLNCLTIHGSVGKCGYCDELIAGMDLEVSYAFGCILCKGSFG